MELERLVRNSKGWEVQHINLCKDILFMLFGIAGVILLIILMIIIIINLLINLTELNKLIIQGVSYAKDKHIFDNKDNIILDKDGEVALYSGYSYTEQIEIFEKAIQRCNRYLELKETFKSKR